MATLEEVAGGLPNGFHDAQLSSCAMDFVARTVTFKLSIWIGDQRDAERYRDAELKISGLGLCAFDAPDPRYPFADRRRLAVDLCDADPAVAATSARPENAFAARFWVANWNSFIHLTGTHAELAWSAGSASTSHGFFLNVDLDIESSEDMAPLAAALEPHAYELERPPGRASFELGEPVSPRAPEPLIREFVRLVEALPPAARAIWDRAQARVFDIGIQSSRHPFQETHSIGPDTLRAAAAIGAGITVTVCGLAPEDDAE
jgi:hypothetical protein